MSGQQRLPVTRWLMIDRNGDCGVYKRQPAFTPGHAIFKLVINLPDERTMDGVINLDIPAADVTEPEVEYVDPLVSLVETLNKGGGDG